MADLTSAFDGLLKAHEAPSTKPFSLDTADEFLKEAYRINSLVARLHNELRNLRQAYLSTAAPRKTHLRAPASSLSRSAAPPQQPVHLTDRDREEIDANAKMTLRDLNARIRALEDAEQLRRDTEAALLRKRLSRGLGGVLDSVMSGKKSGGEQARLVEAAARQLGAHRESVIWFLRTRLQEAARTQQRMMETRLAREMEKNRSVLAKARTSHVVAPAAVHETAANPAKPHPSGGGTGTGLPPREEGNRRIPPDNLTEDQVQMFEKGNQDMLRHLESTLDKVRTAESSLIEIAELQNLLVSNLATQSAHIDQLVADSFETTEGIGKGNKELKKSVGRASPARYTFFAAAGLCTVLILWDLII